MKKKLKGFTLIEALIGLLIFSIIALSLYGVFQSGMHINRRSDDGNQIYREIRWALERITRDLENMVPYDYSSGDAEKVSLTGSRDAISFVTATEDGLKTVSYSLQEPEKNSVYRVIVNRRRSQSASVLARYEEKEDVRLLVRTQRDFAGSFGSSGASEEAPQDILSSNIRAGSLKFSYAYYEGTSEDPKIVWRDTWGNKYVPSGVRVEMIFVKNDKSQAPVVVKKGIYIPTGYLGQ